MERYSYTDMAHDDDLKRSQAEIDELVEYIDWLLHGNPTGKIKNWVEEGEELLAKHKQEKE